MADKSHLVLVFFITFSMGMPQAFASEKTEIIVSIIGDPTIDLNTAERLIRAYVEVINFDPSDGYYYMKIVQSSSGTTISEQEIIIREKGNGLAGASVAYMIDEAEILKNTDDILGNYEIVIETEFGNSVGVANFSISGPDENSAISETKNEQSEIIQTREDHVSTSDLEIQSAGGKIEEIGSKNDVENITKIPEWVKNIFVLYAEEKISENELLEAIKFLIAKKIILI